MGNPLAESELKDRIAAAVGMCEGTVVGQDAHCVSGNLTAIEAKWFLGGRKVSGRFDCTLDPVAHEVRLHEKATESTWGLPPPVFRVETTSQVGTRVTGTKTDRGMGGGGRSEFGRFREVVEKTVRDAGWRFVYAPV